MPDKQEPDRLLEAARYARLRRLACAMRHHIVVHLQPIGMITEVMERRLQCLDVVSWLARKMVRL